MGPNDDTPVREPRELHPYRDLSAPLIGSAFAQHLAAIGYPADYRPRLTRVDASDTPEPVVPMLLPLPAGAQVPVAGADAPADGPGEPPFSETVATDISDLGAALEPDS